jgi:hypothetical protein
VGYVTGSGHGFHDCFIGNGGRLVFLAGADASPRVRGRIVHLLACTTAVSLGPDLVGQGCRAFFGYDSRYSYRGAVGDDALLDVFFGCDAEIDRAFADGLTAAGVYRRVRQKFTREITNLENQGHAYAAATLKRNRDSLCAPSLDRAWGEVRAKLSKHRGASRARPTRAAEPGARGPRP